MTWNEALEKAHQAVNFGLIPVNKINEYAEHLMKTQRIILYEEDKTANSPYK